MNNARMAAIEQKKMAFAFAVALLLVVVSGMLNGANGMLFTPSVYYLLPYL